MELSIRATQRIVISMDGRTEPNNCTGTNRYGGTRFLYDMIWFGSWFVILVRNFGTNVTGQIIDISPNQKAIKLF